MFWYCLKLILLPLASQPSEYFEQWHDKAVILVGPSLLKLAILYIVPAFSVIAKIASITD